MYTSTVFAALIGAVCAVSESWTGHGANLHNNRWASKNTQVNSASIPSLSEHCRLDYQFGASATPVTSGNIVYYPTWNGSFVALDFVACQIKWQINVTDVIVKFAPLGPFQEPHRLVDPASRTSAQVDGNLVYFGTHAHALVVVASRCNGTVLATHQVNAHPMAVITNALTVYKGRVFVGSSSREEQAVQAEGYECCSFRGNIKALSFDRATRSFGVDWEVHTLPEEGGWSGASVWGGQPSVDEARGQIFFGTGNLYKYAPEWAKCEGQGTECIPENIRSDTILSIDIASGSVNFQIRPNGIDAFTLACGVPPIIPRNDTLCPNPAGSDANFGMAPAFVPAAVSGLEQDILIAGQKSAQLYRFAADTGVKAWNVLTSPPAAFAGLSWGVATDDERAYFTGINSLSETFKLIPSGQTINNSAFGASNLRTGEILWETQTPLNQQSQTPPTVVGDIILTGRLGDRSGSPGGALVVLDKKTGAILLDHQLNAVFRGGIAVVNEYVMFGTGYAPFMGYTGNGSFYVMKVAASA